ncbi:uncharacterized protein LOC128985268 [Macrosteles quadrilineatus]|uniref:uncharacterized protein LOC128985268 n=1 Tax=Macrosteles quadrilineatus TaxID=74068 RepID=UPI0023E28362|nr:uncharacterized protein LOC128985268 [Macrosteles quadrilineatus]
MYRKQEMAFTSIIVLLAVFHLSCAIVDTYHYKQKETVDAKNELANYAYDNSQDEFLKKYPGDRAEECKSQLKKQKWYGFKSVSLQTMMIGNVGQIKSIDKDWYDAVQTCKGDSSCIQDKNDTWKTKLDQFVCSAKIKLDAMKRGNQLREKRFMDSCTNDCDSSPQELNMR